ncbi:MAG: hypothetical protein AAGA72_10115 [Pseudomonadota bacterium]
MRVLATIIAATSVMAVAPAIAQPSPEEAMAQCVADVTEKSEAMGHDASKAGEICACLVPKIGENVELISEIESHGGLPGPDEASETLNSVIESCLPTDA